MCIDVAHDPSLPAGILLLGLQTSFARHRRRQLQVDLRKRTFCNMCPGCTIAGLEAHSVSNNTTRTMVDRDPEAIRGGPRRLIRIE